MTGNKASKLNLKNFSSFSKNKILSRLDLYRLKLSKLYLNKFYSEWSSQISLIFTKFNVPYNKATKGFVLFLFQLECIRSIQSGRVLFLQSFLKDNTLPLFSNFWKFNSISFSSYQTLRLFVFYTLKSCFKFRNFEKFSISSVLFLVFVFNKIVF